MAFKHMASHENTYDLVKEFCKVHGMPIAEGLDRIIPIGIAGYVSPGIQKKVAKPNKKRIK